MGPVTAHLLYVTPPLLECVLQNENVCMFLKTRELYPARGNESSTAKLSKMKGPMYINVPRCKNELPCLVLNTTHNHAILVEGNNRLEYFYARNKTWFPVHVVIQDGPLFINQYQGVYAKEEEEKEEPIPLFMKKHYWLRNVKHVLETLFNMQVLNLQEYYNEKDL
jgi:hypothetical protein